MSVKIEQINEFVKNGTIYDYILSCENDFKQSIKRVSKKIFDENIKIILISGPSSAGKTTFTQLLGAEFYEYHINTDSISLDDYFYDRESTPISKNGKPDYESINAIDVELFKQNIISILEGKKVFVPKFDFTLGKRIENAREISSSQNEIIFVEGIHAHNQKIKSILKDYKPIKIFINPSKTLQNKKEKFITPVEIRLMRRIVRDYKFRGSSAIKTLELWTDVRESEKKYILPLSKNADIYIDSLHYYEIGVLKNFLIPLLDEANVKKSVYKNRANHILNLLKDVEAIDDEIIPMNSLIREFIGHWF